jgi:hypothetical protein
VRRRHISARTRERVARAALYRCGYCLTSQRVIGPLLEIDHIVPEAHGGTSHERNLWLACPLCNSHKADRVQALDPATGVPVRFFNPRGDRWSDHFEWAEGGAVIVGTTAIGRTTVAALQMNDPELVAARRLWIIAGWHPPRDV